MSEAGRKALQAFIFDKIHSRPIKVKIIDGGVVNTWTLNLTGQQRDNLEELMRMIAESTQGEKN